MDLKEIEILGDNLDTHWYYRHKSNVLLKLISRLYVRKVLDVGAGSGFFARQALNLESVESAVCIDIGYPSDREEVGANGKSIAYKRSCKSEIFDLVMFMDVLEHVEDDKAMLVEYFDQIKDGGYVFVTVPAFQFLWSSHDIFLGHVRRYSKRQIDDLVRGMGLSIIKSGYCYSAVFPIALVQRLLNRLLSKKLTSRSSLRKHSLLINELLAFACKIESILFPLNPWFGLTVVCLAKK